MKSNLPEVTKPTHTPGPWSFDNRDSDGRTWGYIWPAWEVSLPGATRPPAIARICHTRHKSVQEVDANTRLIAAAPEMLEALEALEQLDDDPNGWDEYCAKVRAAIRKAKGEL